MARLRFLRPLHINKELRQELRPLVLGGNLFILKQVLYDPSTLESQRRQERLKLDSGVDTVPHGYDSDMAKHVFSVELPPVKVRKLMRNIRIVLAQKEMVDMLLRGDGDGPDSRWAPTDRRQCAQQSTDLVVN